MRCLSEIMANRCLTSEVLRLKLANANLSIHGTRDVLEKRWTDYQKKQADQRQQMDGHRQPVGHPITTTSQVVTRSRIAQDNITGAEPGKYSVSDYQQRLHIDECADAYGKQIEPTETVQSCATCHCACVKRLMPGLTVLVHINRRNTELQCLCVSCLMLSHTMWRHHWHCWLIT